jgi:hypothetical protein
MTKPDKSATARALERFLRHMLAGKRPATLNAWHKLGNELQLEPLPPAEEVLEVLSGFSLSRTMAEKTD